MLDTTTRIAAHQRQYFNALADIFDVTQAEEVVDRLRQIVAPADLHPGEAVLDVGTGVGVLIPLIQPYRPLPGSNMNASPVTIQTITAFCKADSRLAMSEGLDMQVTSIQGSYFRRFEGSDHGHSIGG